MNLLAQLDSFKNNQKILSYDQSTNDIINAILKQHNKSLKEYDKLFYFFDCGNYYDTAKKIFNYLKNNIKYQIEPDTLQTVGTPSYILATKKGDCKHFSLMFAGLLDAYRRNTGEKFDLAYRFAGYDKSKTPEHVFVVINSGSENEIWCDAVLDYFNEKKQPNFYKDKKIQNMALMALSGIDNINNRQQMSGALDLTKFNKITDKLKSSGSSGSNSTQAGSGVFNLLQSGASLLPFGSTISSLIGLVGGLIKGHSDYWVFDRSFTDKKYDNAMAIAFDWYQKRGLDPNKNKDAMIWHSGSFDFVPEPYHSMHRIEWLPTIWESTKNPDIAYIINEAITLNRLDKKYFINSKGEMKPEPSSITNIFGGGDGKSGGYTIPLIIGGAAVIAFLIFKKKK
jgi:hypothetical protein